MKRTNSTAVDPFGIEAKCFPLVEIKEISHTEWHENVTVACSNVVTPRG